MSKQRTFFIGDLHFGHSNIIKFEPVFRNFSSIQEHDRQLIENWNGVVTPSDIVFCLGDFSMSAKDIYIAGILNGHKRLVLGNHDKADMNLYIPYFEKIYSSTNYGGYLLAHIPVHPNSLGKFKGQIHGHLHSKNVGDTIQAPDGTEHFLRNKKYLNVSVEQINLTPITFEQLMEKCKCKI